MTADGAPGDARGWYALFLARVTAGDLEGAEAPLGRYLALAPDAVRARLFAARRLLYRGDLPRSGGEQRRGSRLPLAPACLLALALALALVLAGCAGASESLGEGGSRVPREARVPVVFHIMSKCPYAAQVLKPMATVVESMGDWLDFRLEFIGTDGEEGQLGSLHGEPEVLGDRALACGQAHLPGLEP